MSGDGTKLTMNEMQSIAVRYFDRTELKGDKAAHVAALKALMLTKPELLEADEEADAVQAENGVAAEAVPMEAEDQVGDAEMDEVEQEDEAAVPMEPVEDAAAVIAPPRRTRRRPRSRYRLRRARRSSSRG